MLLEVRQLKTHFPIRTKSIGSLWGRHEVNRAVDGVDLTVAEGETLAIIGESGSGKSTLARSILRLIEPTSGEIFFQGQNLREVSSAKLRGMRRKMQIIFQDPYGSLNPRMTVLDLVAESLDTHFALSREERRRQVVSLLERVGLSSDMLLRYPHEFSGGQRQRIGIARAMILKPNLVVADEPVSALDASVQSQVLSLLSDFQKEYRLAYLLISHDLSLVSRFANRTAVMYLGRIVEVAESRTLADQPIHPYTQRLLWAVPKPDPRYRPPAPPQPHFTPYCNHAQEETFNLFEAKQGHWVACHLRPEDAPSTWATR